MPTIPVIDIAKYQRIVVLTGAGVSVASGLPTYRGAGGLWKTVDVEQHATAAAIEADPARVWEFFSKVRSVLATAKPNAAHISIARAASQLRKDQQLTVLTQNVDGLHGIAGAQRVVELHGTLRRSRCTKCAYGRAEDLAATPAKCPMCPDCGAHMRPDVVLFDEPLSVDSEWESKKTIRGCDLFFAVGTSGTVSPASNFVRAAEYAGARTVYVNLEPMRPANPAFQESYLGRAEELLPALLDGQSQGAS
ncbi:MAG TPA: NAD-dependent deacylase [Polyangiaceae bacterium]|jgi:NAD-dependent deacetylase|nr:NAD-dependent deacylase [Polyangiaceae bacterium]